MEEISKQEYRYNKRRTYSLEARFITNWFV